MEPINNSNIDERLAAIAMNLELLSRDREDDKRRIEALLEATARNTEDIKALTAIIREIATQTNELTGIVRTIASETDARLKRLEDRI
jgi:uncharacterized protein YwgA